MRTYKTLPGDNIHDTVEGMLNLANNNKESVHTDFNGVELVADPSIDTAESLISHYHSELAIQQEEYENSEAGQQEKARRLDKMKELQAEANSALDELPDLDFTDFDAVVEWFEKIREPSDHVDVQIPATYIVKVFNDQGFFPGANLGEKFDKNDKENFARYLIGQALDQLEYIGAIHQIYHTFADEWRRKHAN